jgi:hypothetical protein
MMWKRFAVAGILMAAALLLVPKTSRAEIPADSVAVSSGSSDFTFNGLASSDKYFNGGQVSKPVLGAGLTNMALLTGNFFDLLRYFLHRYCSYHNCNGYDDDDDDGYNHHKVPEPATMLLFGSGLLGVAGLSRLRRFNKRG